MNQYYFLTAFALLACSIYAEKSCCKGKRPSAPAAKTHKKSSYKKSVREISTRAELEKTHKEASHVVIEMYATWCPSCEKMKPIYDEVATHYTENKNLILARADVDKDDINALADKLGIQGIPTFLFYKNGELVNTKVGSMSAAQLQEAIDQFLKSSQKAEPRKEKKQPTKPVEKPDIKKEVPQEIKRVPAKGSVQITTAAEYEQKMAQSKVTVLLVTAPAWCGACNMFEPTFEKVAQKYASQINFYWIDADKLGSIAKREAPQGYPTVVFMKDGKKIHSIVGAYPEDKFEREVQKLLK